MNSRQHTLQCMCIIMNEPTKLEKFGMCAWIWWAFTHYMCIVMCINATETARQMSHAAYCNNSVGQSQSDKTCKYTHTTHGTLVVTKTQFHTVVKAHCTNGVWNTILFHFLSDNNKHVSLCMGVVCSASSQCTQIMNMQAYHWNESANKTKDTSSKCNATIVVMTFL